MKLHFIDSPSENFLCERYKVTGCTSFKALTDEVKKLEKAFPDFRFLTTLDDLNQACYTSMHSKIYHDLDKINEDISTAHLPSECFEEGEHIGCLTHKAEFSIRQKNIDAHLNSVTIDDICNKNISLFCEFDDDFFQVNTNPTSLLDDVIFILKVPVQYSYQTLYAFPNGYFSSDLNPFETITLSRILAHEYGYELSGVGASYLAFRKTKPLSEIQTNELLSLLQKIYDDEFDDDLTQVCRHYINNDHLILSYTE